MPDDVDLDHLAKVAAGGAVPGFSTVKLPLNFPKGYHFYFERITVATV